MSCCDLASPTPQPGSAVPARTNRVEPSVDLVEVAIAALPLQWTAVVQIQSDFACAPVPRFIHNRALLR